MGFPDASITSDHLLTASVTLLAFGFLLPSALRRDRTLQPVGKYMAIITGVAVTFCALGGIFALAGDRSSAAGFLAVSLVVFAVLAYFQSRFFLAMHVAEETAKAISEGIAEAFKDSLSRLRQELQDDSQGPG